MGPNTKDMVTASAGIGDGHLPSREAELPRLKDRAAFRRAISRHIIDVSAMKTKGTMITHPRAARRHLTTTVHAAEGLVPVDGVGANLRLR